jgi:hypothetical protein
MSRLLLAIFVLVPTFAVAKPRVSSDGDWVRGTIEIEGTQAAVLEVVEDPHAIARLDGRGTKIAVKPLTDGCSEVRADAPSMIGTVSYVAKQCRTDAGVHAILLQSDDFAVYEARWAVDPADSGVKLRYAIRSAPVIPVPDGVMSRILRRTVRKLLSAIKDEVEAN